MDILEYLVFEKYSTLDLLRAEYPHWYQFFSKPTNELNRSTKLLLREHNVRVTIWLDRVRFYKTTLSTSKSTTHCKCCCYC